MLGNSSIELRLKHLDDNIEQDLALCKNYEDALRYEDEPRRKARYQREIEQLRESADCYQQELDELRKQITSGQTVCMQNVTNYLQQMDNKLNRLFAEQNAIYENINHLRQGLLDRYNASEQNIIAAITEQLDVTQVTTISAVIGALEADQVSESEIYHTLKSIQQSLTALHKHGTTLPPYQQ